MSFPMKGIKDKRACGPWWLLGSNRQHAVVWVWLAFPLESTVSEDLLCRVEPVDLGHIWC